MECALRWQPFWGVPPLPSLSRGPRRGSILRRCCLQGRSTFLCDCAPAAEAKTKQALPEKEGQRLEGGLCDEFRSQPFFCCLPFCWWAPALIRVDRRTPRRRKKRRCAWRLLAWCTVMLPGSSTSSSTGATCRLWALPKPIVGSRENLRRATDWRRGYFTPTLRRC